jgi:hypothetical protein
VLRQHARVTEKGKKTYVFNEKFYYLYNKLFSIRTLRGYREKRIVRTKKKIDALYETALILQKNPSSSRN